MEKFFTSVIEFLIPLVEMSSVVVIVLEVARTTGQYVLKFFKRTPIEVSHLRYRLGRSLVMGLEFQVAADILRTALAPEWNDVLLLVVMIAIRSILNLLLEHELRLLDSREADRSG